MIKAQKNRLFHRVFDIYLRRLLKKHFYKIHLYSDDNLKLLNAAYPTILFANHPNWWDGFIAYYLTSKLWKSDDYLMMDIEQLQKYKAFRFLGVFSIDRTSAAETLKAINYAVSLLKNTNRYLWIFPQGKMEVQDCRPIEFLNGITKIAEKTVSVNLLPVAFRYEFIMEQRPEVFIKIGTPDVFKNEHEIRKDLAVYLREKLVTELDKLKDLVINNNFQDFKTVFHGRESRNKTIDRMNKDN